MAVLLSPIIGKSYESVTALDEEITEVARLINKAAIDTLPLLKPPKKGEKWYKDKTLAYLAKEKKTA